MLAIYTFKSIHNTVPDKRQKHSKPMIPTIQKNMLTMQLSKVSDLEIVKNILETFLEILYI